MLVESDVLDSDKLNMPPTNLMMMRIGDAVKRIRADYLVMPGLRLTVSDAQSFWQLDRTLCEALLAAFVDAGFLRRTGSGAFVRAGSGVLDV